jgi:hypothetical protein
MTALTNERMSSHGVLAVAPVHARERQQGVEERFGGASTSAPAKSCRAHAHRPLHHRQVRRDGRRDVSRQARERAARARNLGRVAEQRRDVSHRATDLGALCYLKDDQSVTITPTAHRSPVASGRVDSGRGVAVEFLDAVPDGVDPRRLGAPGETLTRVQLEQHQRCATRLTAVGCTRSRRRRRVHHHAACDRRRGTVLYFVANGTDNAHTVQYRDATGPTNITTALTASKRHMVIAAFLNGAWRANAYVSP